MDSFESANDFCCEKYYLYFQKKKKFYIVFIRKKIFVLAMRKYTSLGQVTLKAYFHLLQLRVFVTFAFKHFYKAGCEQ